MAFVVLLLQACTWALAAVSALPFGLGGEAVMAALAVPTMGAVALALLFGGGLVARRGWARRWTIALEWTCLAGSLLLFLLPIGTPRGLVALVVNLGLPVAVLWLLMGRRGRRPFETSPHG